MAALLADAVAGRAHVRFSVRFRACTLLPCRYIRTVAVTKNVAELFYAIELPRAPPIAIFAASGPTACSSRAATRCASDSHETILLRPSWPCRADQAAAYAGRCGIRRRQIPQVQCLARAGQPSTAGSLAAVAHPPRTSQHTVCIARSLWCAYLMSDCGAPLSALVLGSMHVACAQACCIPVLSAKRN